MQLLKATDRREGGLLRETEFQNHPALATEKPQVLEGGGTSAAREEMGIKIGKRSICS